MCSPPPNIKIHLSEELDLSYSFHLLINIYYNNLQLNIYYYKFPSFSPLSSLEGGSSFPNPSPSPPWRRRQGLSRLKWPFQQALGRQGLASPKVATDLHLCKRSLMLSRVGSPCDTSNPTKQDDLPIVQGGQDPAAKTNLTEFF